MATNINNEGRDVPNYLKGYIFDAVTRVWLFDGCVSDPPTNCQLCPFYQDGCDTYTNDGKAPCEQ